MLKWTSIQTASDKLLTPQISFKRAVNRKRRATIAIDEIYNKENHSQIITSTPLAPKHRNIPIVLSPLADVLNITPEYDRPSSRQLSRFQSYASTLPRYEEEYSPSSSIMPTGQLLATRGLTPDPFLENPRYLITPKVVENKNVLPSTKIKGGRKRKLENEYDDIDSVRPETSKTSHLTLDRLLDAILDNTNNKSKRKSSRRSFNLRRRTLIKHTIDSALSPSYCPAEDPAGDLSFSEYNKINSSIKIASPKIDKLEKTPETATRNPQESCDKTKLICHQSTKSYFEVGLALPSVYV